MNAKVVKTGSKEVARHPRGALQLSLLAVRYRKALLSATRAAKSAARYGAAAKQAAANPKVQAEARLAAAGLLLAARRAGKVGVANASGDKQLLTELRRAREHAAKAILVARNPKPKRHIVRTTILLTGAGGAAYAGWRAYGRPQPWQGTDGAEDAARNGPEATDGVPATPVDPAAEPVETPAEEPSPE